MTQTYSPLHNHTHYSILDGFSTPEDYLKRCQDLGINAFAITEHGVEYSFPYFAKLKEKYPDVKQLYGVEFYETEDMSIQDKDNKYYHLIAIARNENGRKALNDLVTVSNFDGFYYKPRISIDKMAKYGNDLIISTACLASKIAREKNYNKCIDYINEYKTIFPYFYLEMQSHKHIDQEIYNHKILKLSKDTNTPFIITTDSHAATEKELEYQKYHVMIAQDRETMDEVYEGCYIQSVEEIHRIMDKQIGKENVNIGLENTNIIASLCEDIKIPFQKPKLPHFPLPKGFISNKQYLEYLCDVGWGKRKINKMSEEDINIRKERLKYELSIISQMDFDGYFLILWDALNYARTKDIEINDGRGSGAGSLVCYLLEITNLDPIKYGLIFERFLNPERVGMPDIDNDIDDREIIINYLIEKYGEDKVCQVINFSYITPVVAIKDVASKILKIPYNIADKISKRFAYETFKECLENNPTIYDEYPEHKEWFDIAEKLSGKIRHTSVHAGGVGIVDGNMNDYIGMKLGSKNEHVIQVDKRIIEDIGIVKYDFLGLKTLTQVKDARNEAGLNKWDLDINNPKLENDKKAFDLICSGNTDLVFQMESDGMKDLAIKIQPKTMEELSAVIALYRPDSMPFIDNYLKGKANPNDIEYIHPDMKSILSKTYGALIYQEQILEIVRKFGGRTYGEADLYRKAIGKKDKELIKIESEKLEKEIISNGYSEDIASKISGMLAEMGGYAFNLSHSMAYASLCLKTAFLKAHYPVEFFKSSLNIVDKSKLSKYILDAKKNNVEIVQPNINQSEIGFSIHDNKIVFGFQSIKGLGEKVAEEIINERNKNGKFKNFKDFVKRCNPSESLIVTLVKAGAIPTKDKKTFLLNYIKEELNKNIFEYKPVSTLPTLKQLENEWRIDTKLYNNKEKRLEIYNIKKMELEKSKYEEKQQKIYEQFIDKYMQDEDLWEFETLSVFLSNNPFESIYEEIKPFDEVEDGMSGVVVGVVAGITKKKDRNKNQFAYIQMYSAFGIEEVTCWASQYKKYQDLIRKGNKLAILCNKKEGKGYVNEIKTFDKWKEDRNKILKEVIQ